MNSRAGAAPWRTRRSPIKNPKFSFNSPKKYFISLKKFTFFSGNKIFSHKNSKITSKIIFFPPKKNYFFIKIYPFLYSFPQKIIIFSHCLFFFFPPPKLYFFLNFYPKKSLFFLSKKHFSSPKPFYFSLAPPTNEYSSITTPQICKYIKTTPTTHICQNHAPKYVNLDTTPPK